MALLALVIALQAWTFFQARSMLVFVADGDPVPPPEQMSALRKLAAVVAGIRIPRPTLTDTPERRGWPQETHRIPLANGEWLEGWHVRAPNGRGLAVIAPGYAASRSDFLPAVASWRAIGWDSFVFDFRGAGGSSGSDTTVGAREAEDLTAAFRYAREHLAAGRPVVIYGYSMGGAAALRAIALNGVRPDGLIVVAVYDRLLTAVRDRFAVMGLPSFPAADLMVFWGSVLQGFNGFRQNPAEHARGVHVPTLVLQGGQDVRAPPRAGEAIHAALAGPKALHVFPEGTHVNITGGDADGWIAQVTGFLDRWVPGPAGEPRHGP